MKNKTSKIKRVALLMASILSMGVVLTSCDQITSSLQGPQGIQGIQGIQGEKGDKGEKGDNGKDGKDGQDFQLSPNVTLEEIVEQYRDIEAAQTGFTENNGKFYSDYTSLEEQREAAWELNKQVASEGFVLLKNENNVLPLQKKNISVFAKDSLKRTGQSTGQTTAATFYASLEAEGFKLNPMLKNFFAQKSNTNTTIPTSNMITSTYGAYNDAAIIVIGRDGSEGNDLKTWGQDVNKDKHSLELTDAEKESIKYVKANFDKVVVLIDACNTMELGELAAPKTADNLGVDSILWIGGVGQTGCIALAEILSGKVNPSGRTADTHPVDLTKDPTFANFGDMSQNIGEDGERMDSIVLSESGDKASITAPSGQKIGTDYHSIEYREGIYVGYRYYETKAYDLDAEKAGEGEKWYNENVVYPFGYGLSYTNFEWKLAGISKDKVITKANQEITVKVQVTNTGRVAGKDVVEVYVNPPYTKGGIEKSSANLVGFAKTKLLQPGESEIVTVQFVAQDMASFDWNDANGNGFTGYELEAGKYSISVNKNSHEQVIVEDYEIEAGILCKTDITTGAEIKALFNGEIEGLERYKSTNDSLEANLMTRENGLALAPAATKADRTLIDDYFASIEAESTYFSYQDKKTDPWYVESVPSTWKQDQGVLDEFGHYEIVLADMSGLNPEDTTSVLQNTDATAENYTDVALFNGLTPAQAWELFMNQMSLQELKIIAGFGYYGEVWVDSIGKLFIGATDSSNNFNTMNRVSYSSNGNFGTKWPAVHVWGCTWNQELMYELGRMVGNESLFANDAGWYGTGMNTHRSAFCGRNNEYFSEDGVLAGYLAANVCLGAQEKGCTTFIKHFFMNDQETDRNFMGGLFTWATEQCMREIYAKPFEMAVKMGKSVGIMTAFNRLGDAITSNNYAALECLLRQEWGFKGHVVTDFMDYKEFRYLNIMIRTGTDIPLGSYHSVAQPAKCSTVEGRYDPATNMVYVAGNQADAVAAEALRRTVPTADPGTPQADTSALETVASPTHWYHLRKAAQRVLFNNANCNGIRNGYVGNDTTNKKAVQTLAIASVNAGEKVNYNFASAFAGTEALTFVSATGLPEGLTVSAAGVLSGKVANGVYTITATLLLDNWVDAVVKLELSVGLNGVKAGEALEINLVNGLTVGGNYDGRKIDWIKYSATGLPEGLTIGEADGKISGTPTTAGTYEVTVNITVHSPATSGWNSKPEATYNLVQKLTIVVV